MAVFQYRAIGPDGGRVSGEVEARSRGEALAWLEQQRLQPIVLKQGDVATAKESESDAGPVRLTVPQIILFTEELSDLLDSGMPLEMVLRVMESREGESVLRVLAGRLRQQVREGISLSRALASTSPSFGELYCSMVQAGEMGGALSEILRKQAAYLKALQELKAKVQQALVYPSVLLGAAILVMVLFSTVLVPLLQDLFSQTGQEVPQIMRLMLAVTGFFYAYWWLVLGLMVLTLAAFLGWISTEDGRLWWHRTMLALPLLGPVLRARMLAQMAETLANLTSNGIPLLTGLKLLARSTGNRYYRLLLQSIAEEVGDGRAFSRALSRSGGFPGVFVDVVAVGEQAGQISAALSKLSQRFEKEMDRRVQFLTTLVQPLIIVVMALIVGAVAWGIVTSIFQAVSGVRSRRQVVQMEMVVPDLVLGVQVHGSWPGSSKS